MRRGVLDGIKIQSAMYFVSIIYNEQALMANLRMSQEKRPQ